MSATCLDTFRLKLGFYREIGGILLGKGLIFALFSSRITRNVGNLDFLGNKRSRNSSFCII